MAAGSPPSPVLESRRPVVGAGVPLVGGARLPLSFIILGLLALTMSSIWIVVEPTLPLLPHMHPSVLAIAHLWLPGFLLSVSFGAAYQLIPVVLGVPLRGVRIAWTHLMLHACGLPLLVGGFVSYHYETVAIGGTLIAVGVFLFSARTILTFRESQRRDAIAWSLPLAATWLSLTVTAGVLMALNRHWPVLAWSALALLRAHAHLGFAGFFLTLLQGMTFQLVPMFTLGEVRHPRRIAAGIACTQAGLLTLVPGLAWDSTALSAIGAGLLAMGLLFSGLELRSTLRSRKKRLLEPGLRAFISGAAILLIAAVAGISLLIAEPSTISLRGAMSYGLLVVPGALALMVLGMLCKIIPFLVWMRAYGPRVGKQPIPAAGTLAKAGWERLWLWLHGSALVLLATGALMDSPASVRLGAVALLAGIGFFLMNTGRVLAHLWRPALSAPAALSSLISKTT
jgi:hypothetical protein